MLPSAQSDNASMAVVRLPGGEAFLHAMPRVPMDWIPLLRHGLPSASINAAIQLTRIPQADLARALNIPERTLARCKRESMLSLEESAKLVRFARVVERAAMVFESAEAALSWPQSPNASLGRVTPLSLLDTEIGAGSVLDILGRIEHGVLAYMPVVWRVTTARLAESAFSGEGARLYGGRWNPKGWPTVRAAQSQSLTLLELLVQDDPLRAHYVPIPANIPAGLAKTRVGAEALPADWRTIGARATLQEIGRAWLDSGKTAVLSIPSAVVPAERNYLLNPRHPDFTHIEIRAPLSLDVDTRLLRNLA